MGGGQVAGQQTPAAAGTVGLGAPVYSPFLNSSGSNMKLSVKSQDAAWALGFNAAGNFMTSIANMGIAENNKDVAIAHTQAGRDVAIQYYKSVSADSANKRMMQKYVSDTQKEAIKSNERMHEKQANLELDKAKLAAKVQTTLAKMQNDTKVACMKIGAANDMFSSDFNKLDSALGLAKYSYGNTVG